MNHVSIPSAMPFLYAILAIVIVVIGYFLLLVLRELPRARRCIRLQRGCLKRLDQLIDLIVQVPHRPWTSSRADAIADLKNSALNLEDEFSQTKMTVENWGYKPTTVFIKAQSRLRAVCNKLRSLGVA